MWIIIILMRIKIPTIYIDHHQVDWYLTRINTQKHCTTYKFNDKLFNCSKCFILFIKSDAAITYMTISNMIKILTIGNASITYQTINNMSNYVTNSTFNTLVNTLTSLSGILHNELLSFQTISSYYLLKTDAQNIYQTINNMSSYLTIGSASITYQTITICNTI